MRTMFVLAGVVSVAACAGSVMGANLLTNGSFENPGFTGGIDDGRALYFYTRAIGTNAISGWQHDTSLAYLRSRAGAWTAAQGEFYIEVESGFAPTIAQSFATEIGAQYQITFAYAANPDAGGNDDALAVLWNGGLIDTLDAQASTLNALDWKYYSYTMTATSETSTLTFGDAVVGQFYNGAYLDDVSVTLVPTPGSLALLGLGRLALGRRRR